MKKKIRVEGGVILRKCEKNEDFKVIKNLNLEVEN